MSTQTINILFTSVGRRVSLIRKFKNALDQLAPGSKVYSTDMRKDAPAAQVTDEHFLVPKVTDESYIDRLIEICDAKQINIIIPLIDTELIPISSNQDKLKAKGILPIVCSEKINQIAFNKFTTYKFFKENGIQTPKILTRKQIEVHDFSTPLFLKPAEGSCSVGATKIDNEYELDFYLKTTKEPIVQEFINGQEFTVDVLFTLDGKLSCIVPRKRIETRAGEVSKGITVKNQKIINAVKKLCSKLEGAIGCVTIQCFLTDDEQVFFIELNPRFGGGIPLTLEAGAPYEKWIIQMILEQQPQIEIDQWKDGVVMLRYDDAIFTTLADIQ